ncbi:hypothetical protein M0802_004528 [Mischocyttarus mexicanus]|nr:hypothetical protein M0802_004528 [Mischocyttarus mexicanus]
MGNTIEDPGKEYIDCGENSLNEEITARSCFRNLVASVQSLIASIVGTGQVGNVQPWCNLLYSRTSFLPRYSTLSLLEL